MKTISFFAGVGGIDLAFERAGFKCVWANEIDQYAAKTYKANFNNELIVDDIRSVGLKFVPNSDVLLAGFPCQPFSLAGYRKGFNDERGNLFFDLMRFIEKKLPPVLFLENVKNLVGHDSGRTFEVILKALKTCGYHIKHKVMNACDYANIPQNRERIYIVAFRDKQLYKHFTFPEAISLKKSLKDFIYYNEKVDDKYYYTEEKCKFYHELRKSVINPDTVYQWRRVYVRENKSNLCPTLTANMGTGGHNVPLIKAKHGIRKLTPRECFNLQGYGEEYIIPKDLSNTRLYKQAGNSVVVPVVERIATQIMSAFNSRVDIDHKRAI
ncbi:DNA cytosine methyltransferase [Alkaliphilus sp. AH-315-G20]|nr:DNA cytosine methyltransferase [Alkaliphilus sp. AH-315-G20]